MTKYNPSEIEKKWQKNWEKQELYRTEDKVADKKNFYKLTEFPYPSGNLHMGHWYAFSVPDIFARFKRMQGYNVLYPMGFDAFGLPAENAAIKNKLQPKEWTDKNVKYMTEQMKSMGTMFDWSRAVNTTDPDYYKWTQWIFLQFYKHGLAYRAKTAVNWCPKDKTVLANEQVVDGTCDRCGSEVEQREREQWMYRITKYADQLLEGLNKVDWPEVTKTAQRNWIGKSEGALIKFDDIEVFTTRPDTILGATFIALPSSGKGEKFTGKHVVNPATGEKIPVWTADYVLDSYGTGAIMGVPAYDERDEAFAKKHSLPIVKAILTDKIFGTKTTKYRLHDWILSRQRYWGTPIPLVFCKNCAESSEKRKAKNEKEVDAMTGWIPVPEDQLPVKLPKLENYLPADDGNSPLARAEKWVKTKCPQCGEPAMRETDTMDTFVDSSWYFLRYTDPENKKELAGKEKINTWCPVNLYTGGAEHNTMHLLYSRFFTKALHELGFIDFDEPFTMRRNHGIVLGPDGQKMSKSKGNVVDPDKEVAQYGADTVRMYLAFLGPYDTFNGPWDPRGISGIWRFLNRVWAIADAAISNSQFSISKQDSSPKLEKILNKAIKKVGEDIEQLHFNTAISALMILLNEMEKSDVSRKQYETFLKLLSPFAPHLVEELWHQLGHTTSIHLEKWPQYDSALIKDEVVTIAIQISGKTRGTVHVPSDSTEDVVSYAAQEMSSIQKYLEGKTIAKTIFIKNKLINFVL